MAPVYFALKSSLACDVAVAVTAQHREMLDQVLDLFHITPEYDLNIMKPGQSLEELTARVLLGLKSVFDNYSPDLVLVHGDTTTAFVACLGAFYKRIPVGHVEAGLRTKNIYSPWPEEANRKLISGMSALNFAPTVTASENLLGEGVDRGTIKITGNTVVDALLEIDKKLKADSALSSSLDASLGLNTEKRLILVTGHRRESFGEGFDRICRALSMISKLPEVQVVYPVHLNPMVEGPVRNLLEGSDNVLLLPPVDYLPFVHLMRRASIVLTDSGGVQEEAPSLGKPVLVMRENSERPEAILAGTAKLVGTDPDKIYSEVHKLLTDHDHYSLMSTASNPYGDGNAAQRICEAVERYFTAKL